MVIVGNACCIHGENAGAPKCVEYVLHNPVHGDVVGGEDRFRLILPADGRFGCGAGLADDEALMLECDKAEELVFKERATEGETGVVVADLLLGSGEGTLCAEKLRCD